MIAIVPLAADQASAVEELLDRAFGPERRTRTAYAVRGAGQPIADLSFAAIGEDGMLAGSIQCWPVELALDTGGRTPLVMIGPVAVQPYLQQEGLGRRLMQAALDAAAETGLDRALMLIGDPEYYERFFDFTAERTARWRLPGPVERRRLLARGCDVPDAAGILGPATA